MRHISEKNHSAVKTCSICNEKVTSITDQIVSVHAKKNEKCPYCAQAFALKQVSVQSMKISIYNW